MAAFLAPLLGAGLSFGLGKLNNPAKSPTFRRAEQLGDLSKEFAFDYALPEGKKLLGEAESTLQKPEDYYSKLLSGNRAEMMSAEAPEIQTINDQYNQQRQNIAKFTPQGGGQTTALSELPFQQSRDVTSLLEKARPDAAQNLEKIAGEQGALSGMVTSEGLQGGQLGLNAISDQLNYLLGKAGQNNPLMQQAGGGLYSILKNAIGGGASAGMGGPGQGGEYTDPGGGVWGGGWDFGGGAGGDMSGGGGDFFSNGGG